MSASTRMGPVAMLWVALGALPLLAGCGTSIEDLCDEMCDCEGCSDSEYDECVEEGEEFQDQAEDAGCGDEFDDYVDCIADTAHCDGDNFDADEDCFQELYTCGGLGIDD